MTVLSSGRAGGGPCLCPSTFGQTGEVSHRFGIALSLSRYSHGKQEVGGGCVPPAPSRRPDGAGMLGRGKKIGPCISCISSGAR